MGASGPSEVTDDALIREALEQPEVFGQLYDRHAAAVHRYLTSRVGVQSADDLLSEVFVTAFRCRSRYDVKFTEAVPWLLGIAANVVRHHRRSESRRSALQRRLVQASNGHGVTDVGNFATDIIGHADFEDVRRAVEQLDERCRDVLILFAAFDLSYAQIAEALNLRIGTVRSRISRGRAQLRELLARSGQYVADDEREDPSQVRGRTR